MNLIFRNILVVGLLITLFSCGGGGGGSSADLSTNSCSDIGLGTKNLKIINGTACSGLSQSPVVRLAMYDAFNNPIGLCSGTLIQPNAVLTAAHCNVQGTVAAGAIYGDPGSTTYVSVKTIKTHPGYVPLAPANGIFAAFNDIAVYVLRENINLPTLPLAQSVPVQAGDVIDIYGYGTDEDGDLSFEELKSGQMLVDSVSENHISTVFNGEGSNTCQGDSGGPATIKINGQSALAGITSTGTERNCVEGDNSLFINLQNPSVRDFILSVATEAGVI